MACKKVLLQYMSGMSRRNSHGYIASLVVTAISVAITLFLVVNRQIIVDTVSAWQYEPTSEISAFVERTGMSEKGEFLFYASQPSLEGTQAFNSNCSRIEKSTAILGCYDGRQIYIYDVPNQKLDGIREVTSAHEMLHAAYIRLDDEYRREIDALLEAEYEKLKDNAEFSERMEFYARTEPGERANELHSIIGTEIAQISPQLETHYKRYFDDRNKTVALHSQYASVFAGVQARGKELSQQLTVLADQIDNDTVAYNAAVNQLNQDIAQFKARAENGEFESQQELDVALASLTARSAQLDARLAAIKDSRETYNALREELIAIASESEALNRSIDSSLAPAPSL